MELRPLRFNSFPATATATPTRADALQWLSNAENCLSIRNLFGSKTFATKARDFDPGLYPAEQMLAVADTLIAGDIRIGGGSLRDWYGVLRLPQGSTSPPELISHEYHNLIALLHPQKNKYPYADCAFGLVVEAWTVLSHPLKKSQYDKELARYFQQQQQLKNQSQPFIDNLPAIQQDFGYPGGNAAPANPQVQQDFGYPGGNAAPANPQVQQDFVIPGANAALPNPQVQQDFVYPGGNAAPPNPQVQQDFVYPGANAAPPTPQMQQDFVYPGGNATPPTPPMQQDFVYLGGNAVPPTPQMQQGFVYPRGNAAPPTPQMHVEFQQVNGNQPQVVDSMMSSGATGEFQSFMPFNSNFLFGSGSGAGGGSSHEYANNGVQENVFSGFVGGGDMCAAPFVNQNQVNGCNDMQNQQQENYAYNSDTANFNVNGCNDMQNQQQENYVYNSDTANFNMNVNENVGGMRQDEAADLEEMDKLDAETFNDESLDVIVKNGAGGESTFWTACPYCYHMYEYPSVYKDCSLRCEKCKCAFHGLVIQSPPPIVEGQESYYCGWASAPMGFSKENLEKNTAAESTWTPFSSMFAAPSMGNANNAKKKRGGWNSGPRVYIDDDDFHVDISSSDSSSDDWQNGGDRRKKARNAKGKGLARTPNKSAKEMQVNKAKHVDVQDEVEIHNTSIGEPGNGNKDATVSAHTQPAMVAKDFGELGFNVQLSNEAEAPAQRVHAGIELGHEDGENIEGGFFDGLEEYLSSCPGVLLP